MARLVLFDIDGTILSTQGVGRRALSRGVAEAFKIDIKCDHLDLSGKTDPQICREMLTDSGYAGEITGDLLQHAFDIYLPILKSEIALCKNFALLKGIHELVNTLNKTDDAYLALLTGNIEPGARIKLDPFNLNHFFVVGAYGSDSANRLELPAIASQRSAKHFSLQFQPHEVVVIGDSTRDIACAKGFGARSLAVSTGKTSAAELQAEQPDFLFSSLEDTANVIEAIFSESNSLANSL
ncbi:MAG: HAD hydrolase-like protein [Candidatus Obscuribacterales bacterium]|nr:HAD hydrolase-like protein [Candidatus Obscuribacterales bacterium]